MQTKFMSELIFSQRLREAVTDKGVNQEALAKAVGVSQGSVSGWFNGAIPSADKLTKIAEHLGVRSEWLIAGKGPKREIKLIELTAAEIDAIKNSENKLSEDVVIYGTDWKTRAITAEQKLADLKASFAELFVKHEIPIPPPTSPPQTLNH